MAGLFRPQPTQPPYQPQHAAAVPQSIPGVTGTSDITLPSMTMGVSGAETISGTVALVLPSVGEASTGSVLNPVTGTAALVLPSLVESSNNLTASGQSRRGRFRLHSLSRLRL